MMRMFLFRLLPVVLLVLLGYVLATGLERVDKVVDQGAGLEARRNQFLAAGQLLEQQGHRVEHSRYPVAISQLGVHDSLLLTSADYLVDEPARVEALLAWVEAGGHLLWYYTPVMEAHPLAQSMGVGHVKEIEEKQTGRDKRSDVGRAENVGDVDVSMEMFAAPQDVASSGPAERVRMDIRMREAQVSDSELSRFEPADDARIYSLLTQPLHWQPASHSGSRVQLDAQSLPPERTHLLSLRLGSGRITVLRDISIWYNNRIGLFDHAHLLLWLNRDNQTVHLQRYNQWPPLSQLILNHAPEALTAGVLLLLGWLLYHGRRFGLALQPAHQQRRTLNEHIEAVARFHHRQGQWNHLLAPLRRQVMSRAALMNGGLDQPSTEQQQAAIAELTQLQPEQVRQALTPQEHYSSTELVETVQLLLRIRNRL